MDHAAIRADYHAGLIAEALDLLEAEEMAALPFALRAGLRRYLVDRIPTGGFLRACLENDFAGAMSWANPHLNLPHLNLPQLKLIAQLLNSSFPVMAWGSPEKVAAWLAKEEDGTCQAK